MKTKRPERNPDWICKETGYYFWFAEMVYDCSANFQGDGPWKMCLRDDRVYVAKEDRQDVMSDDPRDDYFPGVDDGYFAWLSNQMLMEEP